MKKDKKLKNPAPIIPNGLKNELLGGLVVSISGRDSGKHFLVVQVVSEDYIMVSDGDVHKLAKPKRKNRKHVKFLGKRHETIANKLIEGTKVFDSEVYSGIKKLTTDDQES